MNPLLCYSGLVWAGLAGAGSDAENITQASAILRSKSAKIFKFYKLEFSFPGKLFILGDNVGKIRVGKSWQHGQQADGTFEYFMHFSEHSGLDPKCGHKLIGTWKLSRYKICI